jgi:LemA protein
MSRASFPRRPLRAPTGRRARRGAISKGCAVGLAAIGGLVLIGLILFATGAGKYNALVAGQEVVAASWSEVQNQYKRRYDLVPNLVETVQGAAEFEKSVLTDVIEARAKVGQVRLPDQLPTDERELQAYIQAQQGLSGALGRLFALAENYPQLKATQNFLSLQDQLEGTENRIAVARRDFIDAVRGYNTARRRFPANLVAGMFGFEAAAQLEVPEEEQATPKVDFDFGGEQR